MRLRHLFAVAQLALLTTPRSAWADQGFAPVDHIMRRGLRERAFESAVLRVSHGGRLLFEQAYGNASPGSVFDLASLTKPLATTTSLMRLTATGKLAPETRLRSILPELSAQPIGQASLAQLLSHSAGLPARNTLRDQARGLSPEQARRAIPHLAARTARVYRPGTQALYSDLDFLLLGWATEQAAGLRLDALSDKLVFAPLGLHHTRFLPRERAARRGDRAALVATEKPRGEPRLRGVVHDEKARAMGGVAGHAGLFSTAHDVQRILDSLLAAYHGRPSLFSPAVVRRFLDSEPVPGSGRTLGWDTPRPTTAGSLFHGRRAVGHTGFTGTSAWMDLDSELVVVLLTNRVFYGRDATKIKRYRALAHDALRGALATN